MSSVVISNIPQSVSDVAILKFLSSKTEPCRVEHIQPFPDAYHHINEHAGTRSVQMFLKNGSQANYIKSLFELEESLQELVKIQRDLNISHELVGGVPLTQSTAGRRLSVTTAS